MIDFKHPKIIIMMMLIAVISMIGLYLYQTGDLTRTSYLIKNYQIETAEIIAQNSNLLGRPRTCSGRLNGRTACNLEI